MLLNETEIRSNDSDDDPGDKEFIEDLVNEIVETVIGITSDKIPCDVRSTEQPEVKSVTKRPQIFPCPSCRKMFAQFQSAANHCKAKHEAISILCPKCNKTVKEKRNLKMHVDSCKGLKSKDSKLIIKCDGCEKILSSEQRLRSHMASMHGIVEQRSQHYQILKCPKCTFSHTMLSVMKMHLSKYHLSGVKVNCQKCDYVCYSKSGLRKHQRSVHKICTEVDLVDKTTVSQDMMTVTASTSSQFVESYAPPTPVFLSPDHSHPPAALMSYQLHELGPTSIHQSAAPPPHRGYPPHFAAGLSAMGYDSPPA